MSVLVIGACGMIGGQVIELLLSRDESVVGFDARPPSDDIIGGIPFVRGDLNDAPRLYGTLKRHGIRQIVHAGAISAPMMEADNPYLVCQTNVLGTVQVFEAARVFGIERVINFGSVSGYGTVLGETITEETPFAPTSVYGVTKAFSDMLGTVYSKDHGLDVISLRPSLVYGPRRPSWEPVREMIRGGLDGLPVQLNAAPDQTHAPVYARDVARAVIAALAVRDPAQRSLNIGGSERTTLAATATLVRTIVPGPPIAFEQPASDPAAPGPACLDFSAATRVLGYVPEWPLERAIANYATWLRAHRS